MGRAPSVVVGIDVGCHTLKGVLLGRKKAGVYRLSGFGTRVVETGVLTVEQMAHHLKLLAREIGGSGAAVVAAIGGEEALLRIIEQPATTPDVLRGALKLNGQTMLLQECSDHVLDCDVVPQPSDTRQNANARQQFLVAGAPRARVMQIAASFEKAKLSLNRLQLAPVSLYNAFEFARPQVFLEEGFLLVDIGHTVSTILAGMKGSLFLIRKVAYGGATFLRDVTMDGALDQESALTLIEQEDAGMAEAGQESLGALGRDIVSSIGFCEGKWDRPVSKVFVSGGLAHSEMFQRLLGEQISLPCELWSPLDVCEIGLSRQRREKFEKQGWNLNVACEAAIELLNET